MFDTPFNCLLIGHQGTLLLVGIGAKAKPLLENLRQAGIAPEDVGIVLLSNAHADHYGSAVDSAFTVAHPDNI